MPSNHPGKGNVVQILDEFDLSGPNGRHFCLVVEVVGLRIEPDWLSPETARDIARQLVEATAYFHGLGVVHGGKLLMPRE